MIAPIKESCFSSAKFLADEAGARAFIAMTTRAIDSYAALLDKSEQRKIKDAVVAMDVLRKQLVDESESKKTISEFNDAFTNKGLAAVKLGRIQLKQMFDGMSEGAKQKAKDVQDVLDTAKFQSFKFGVAKFMNHAGIKALTKEGVALRQNLQDIWKMDSLDDSFRKYLGESDVEAVQAMLKFTKDNKSKKKEAPEQESPPEPSKKKQKVTHGGKAEAEEAQISKKPETKGNGKQKAIDPNDED